jgi:WD40 repeat protein
MASISAGNLRRQLGRLFGTGSPVGLTDSDLLERCAHSRLKMSAVVLSFFVIAAGIGLAVPGTPAAQVRTPNETAAPTVATPSKRSTSLDGYGDPLPQYARARMGTIRFHDGSLVKQVLFTPDSKSLVTVDNIPIVRVWDASTGRAVRQIGSAPAGLPQVTASRKIALSPDGKMLATVDYPSRLRLWDIATGRERRSWHEPKDQRYGDPIFSPDGRTLAVSVTRYDRASDTSETFIELWDTTSPTEHRRRIPGGWVVLWDLKFSPDGKILATASRDAHNMRGDVLIGPASGSTRIWDIAAGREQRRFPIERLDVKSLAFSRAGTVLAAASDETIRFYNLGTGRERMPRLFDVASLGFSPDGTVLAAAVRDGTIRFYNLATGHECMPSLRPAFSEPPGGDVKARESRPTEIGSLAFSPDGSILAVAAASGDLTLATIDHWDLAKGQKVHRIPTHQQSVGSLFFAPDGKTLASTGEEPFVRLWDVATAREVFPQSGHRSAVSTLVVPPADGSVFTGSPDGTIRHWDPTSGRELDVVAQHSGPVDALCVSPDGKTLLLVGAPSKLGEEIRPRNAGWFGLWSVAERREMRRLGSHPENGIANAVYAPDGKTFASQGRIWDAVSGKFLVTLRHEAAANDRFLSWCPVFFAADGKQLITAEPDGAWIWDGATGRELRQAVRWSNHHDGATISPDGRFLATRALGDGSGRGWDDQPIILWELASGQQVASLEALDDANVRRPFSPDGRFLASACRHQGTMPQSTVRVLDLATGREVRRFEGHRGSVNAIAFTPDGRSVVSGSNDATALIWDISDLSDRPQTGEPMAAEMLKARWDELAGNDAAVAYRATWALCDPRVIPFLRERLLPAASPAAERIPKSNEQTGLPGVLRTLRAMTALERIGTPAVRSVLEQMAQGHSGAIESREAKGALLRLTRRSRVEDDTARRKG